MTGTNGTILSRDLDGAEHAMTVIVRNGLICISDDVIERIISIDSALELSWRLIECVIRHRQSEAGPLSSTF